MRHPLFAVVPAACTVFLAGCGCGGAVSEPPIAFTTSSVAAVRTPSGCGVADPPYSSSDVFTLTIVGNASGVAPYNTLTLNLHDTSSSTTAIPLTVPMSSGANPPTLQMAESTDSDITFSFARGSNATEVDSTFLSSVLVTVVSVPAADGQNLSANLAITFTDGSELQATYTAAVTTTDATCVTSGVRQR